LSRNASIEAIENNINYNNDPSNGNVNANNTNDKYIDKNNNINKLSFKNLSTKLSFDNLDSLDTTTVNNNNNTTATTQSSILNFKNKFRILKVLVVEDTISVQKLLKFWLQKNNCEVTCANNGKIAMDLMIQNKFDIVFLDFLMVFFFFFFYLN
jgi:PleD family two-component response regulator